MGKGGGRDPERTARRCETRGEKGAEAGPGAHRQASLLHLLNGLLMPPCYCEDYSNCEALQASYCEDYKRDHPFNKYVLSITAVLGTWI